MSDNIDLFLSDKFFEYTEKLRVIFEKKKALDDELKEFYKQHKDKMKVLKDEASELKREWEAKSEKTIKEGE